MKEYENGVFNCSNNNLDFIKKSRQRLVSLTGISFGPLQGDVKNKNAFHQARS